MKTTKRILSILLACVMLACVMPMAVSAAGTQDDPIDAKDKWMGYGVDAYVLNPTIADGGDGMWYTLTAEQDGILVLDHSYKNVDYTVYTTLNGVTYEGGCVDGEPYNRPIVTAPIQVGDVATIQIATKDAAAGTVYASMEVIAGDIDDPVKAKSDGLPVVIGAGQTVYFQDDSLDAIYATKGLLVKGDVADTTFYTVSKNSESGTATEKPFTDSDADGIIEVKLGGSLGGAGAPPVKPAWAIENASNEDRVFTLTIVDAAHECVYDNDADTDCNTCGAIREVVQSCQHSYDNTCDTDCNLCGEVRATEHTYSSALDVDCDVCGAVRELELPLTFDGASVSEDVNGLACRFNLEAEGLTANNAVAVYDNATFYGLKLVSMGAVACNNYKEGSPLPTIEDANGKNTLNIPATYLCEVNPETGTASYAIRIVSIPDNQKDTNILFVPYVVVEDDAGTQYTLYLDQQIHSYNSAAN